MNNALSPSIACIDASPTVFPVNFPESSVVPSLSNEYVASGCGSASGVSVLSSSTTSSLSFMMFIDYPGTTKSIVLLSMLTVSVFGTTFSGLSIEFSANTSSEDIDVTVASETDLKPDRFI